MRGDAERRHGADESSTLVMVIQCVEAIAQRPSELLAATKRALWAALEARAT